TSRRTEVVEVRGEAHAASAAFGALSRLLRAMFHVAGLSNSDARAKIAARYGDMSLKPHSLDARILVDAMGIAETDASPLHVSANGRRRRLIDMMLKSLSSQSGRTLFVVEDAHWIDVSSDDVLAEFASALKSTTSLFVATYRPEFHGALR